MNSTMLTKWEAVVCSRRLSSACRFYRQQPFGIGGVFVLILVVAVTLSVCVCVCVHTCVFSCMHASTSMYIYLCMHAALGFYLMCVYLSFGVFVRMYVCRIE